MENLEQEKAIRLEAFKEKMKRLQTELKETDQTIQGVPVENLKFSDMETWEESRNILKKMREILQEQDFSVLKTKIKDLIEEIDIFITTTKKSNIVFQGWVNNRISYPKSNCVFIQTQNTREEADVEAIIQEIDTELQQLGQ